MCVYLLISNNLMH